MLQGVSRKQGVPGVVLAVCVPKKLDSHILSTDIYHALTRCGSCSRFQIDSSEQNIKRVWILLSGDGERDHKQTNKKMRLRVKMGQLLGKKQGRER